MHSKFKGFTLIELIVVIAIIGILATIATIGFGQYQTQTRDARRDSSAKAISEGLEKYYDENGEYPSCAAITGSPTDISKNILKSISIKTLIAPQATSNQTNSIKCTSDGNILVVNGDDFFEYQGDGSSDCNGSGSCLGFVLKYKDETDGKIKTITSRRNTNIATSGNVTNLTASSNAFTTANLSWKQIQNATSYDIQRSNNANFSSGVVTLSSIPTNYTVTGLAASTTYYFRVRPVGSSGSAVGWSNVAQATTISLGVPNVTIANNSSTQATISWNAVTYATSYTSQYSKNSTFASDTVSSSGTATSKVVTGLTPGQTYYVRVQAISPDDTSDWSTTKSFVLTVPPPTAAPSIAASLISNNTVARGTASSSAACTAGATLQHEIQYNSTNSATPGSWSAWTIANNTMDVGTYQGNKYTFQARSRCIGSGANSSYSATSGQASVITPISTPPSPGWATTTQWSAGYNYQMTYSWSCPTGTNIGPEGVQSYSNNNTGNVRPTPWVDWWYVGWNAGQFDADVTYTANYRCRTAYVDTWSPSTTTGVHITCDPSRRSFDSYPRCDNYGQGQGGNGNGNY